MKFRPGQSANGIKRSLAVLTWGLGLMICLCAPVLAQENPFKGGWTLDAGGSALGFQSIKNETKVEISSFASLTGDIAEDGTARVSVLLDSVDTTIDLRNVRMRFLFFETFTYPEAVITARITPAMLEGLEQARRKTVRLPYELNLHGVTKALTADVTVTLLDDARVAVATALPISVAAADFNLSDGVRKLEEAASVSIVPSATVSFDLLFTKAAVAPPATTPAAAPQKPASVALEAEGDFDLEACLGRFEILSRSGNIYFQPGSDRLEPESTPILTAIVDIIQRCPSLTVQVAGHTDSIGPERENQRLSEKRAQAVSRYLIDKGVSAARFQVIGYGEARPTADNTTAEGRSRNRRIEFTGVSGG